MTTDNRLIKYTAICKKNNNTEGIPRTLVVKPLIKNLFNSD